MGEPREEPVGTVTVTVTGRIGDPRFARIIGVLTGQQDVLTGEDDITADARSAVQDVLNRHTSIVAGGVTIGSSGTPWDSVGTHHVLACVLDVFDLHRKATPGHVAADPTEPRFVVSGEFIVDRETDQRMHVLFQRHLLRDLLNDLHRKARP